MECVHVGNFVSFKHAIILIKYTKFLCGTSFRVKQNEHVVCIVILKYLSIRKCSFYSDNICTKYFSINKCSILIATRLACRKRHFISRDASCTLNRVCCNYVPIFPWRATNHTQENVLLQPWH